MSNIIRAILHQAAAPVANRSAVRRDGEPRVEAVLLVLEVAARHVHRGLYRGAAVRGLHRPAPR